MICPCLEMEWGSSPLKLYLIEGKKKVKSLHSPRTENEVEVDTQRYIIIFYDSLFNHILACEMC